MSIQFGAPWRNASSKWENYVDAFCSVAELLSFFLLGRGVGEEGWLPFKKRREAEEWRENEFLEATTPTTSLKMRPYRIITLCSCLWGFYTILRKKASKQHKPTLWLHFSLTSCLCPLTVASLTWRCTSSSSATYCFIVLNWLFQLPFKFVAIKQSVGFNGKPGCKQRAKRATIFANLSTCFADERLSYAQKLRWQERKVKMETVKQTIRRWLAVSRRFAANEQE